MSSAVNEGEQMANGSVTVDLPRVVSVDDHVVEPPDLWQRRLPRQLRDRGPRVVRDSVETRNAARDASQWIRGGDGPLVDLWEFGDVWKPIPQTNACVGFAPEEMTIEPISYADMRPGCYDPAARLLDMDLNHTDVSLCFPTFPRFCGQEFTEVKDRQLGLGCIEAYNDWMIEEWCGDSGGRLLPLCLIPLWDAKLAAAEVRRNAARGCRAVTFTELPAKLGLRSIHDPDRFWDPLFQACDETGTVVCIHFGSSSHVPGTSADAPKGVHMALTFTTSVASFADWMLSGVLARFPNLKVAFSEGQIGWIPFVLERLDNAYRRAWTGLDPAITDLPSTYLPGRVYGCFFQDYFGLSVRDAIGVEQITFETDYPHQDTTWPNTFEEVARMADMVPPDDLYAIVRGNAISLFGLDIA
jgi:predicted TIM-barrel fold metal-dependent hydrolase